MRRRLSDCPVAGWTLVIAVILVQLTGKPPALAGETDDGGAKAGTGGAEGAPPVMPNDVQLRLKGAVKGTALPPETGLKKLDQDSAAIKRISLAMIAEMTRKETVSVRQPNVLPNGVVIPPMPLDSGVAQLGPLPPRSGQINFLMKQLAAHVQVLGNEIDALIIPEDKASQVAETWTQVRQQMSAIQAHFAALQALSAGPEYDTKKIGRESLFIYDASDRIRKLCKKIHELIKS